jgi:hypothetical protein
MVEAAESQRETHYRRDQDQQLQIAPLRPIFEAPQEAKRQGAANQHE